MSFGGLALSRSGRSRTHSPRDDLIVEACRVGDQPRRLRPDADTLAIGELDRLPAGRIATRS
jgi:hypothetical protein